MEMKNNEKTFSLNLTSPNDTKAIVGIPKTDKNITEISLNGSVIWVKGKPKQHNKVTSILEDHKYIKIEVASGEYQFFANSKN